MINLRFCKRCKRPYDIGTNFDICPLCRKKDEIKKEEEEDGRLEV